MGLAKVPDSTAISGWRIADFVAAFFGASFASSFFSWAASVTAAAITTSTLNVLRLKLPSTLFEDYDTRALSMELIPRPPVHQFRLIRDIHTKEKAELRRLLQRGEVPIALKFV